MLVREGSKELDALVGPLLAALLLGFTGVTVVFANSIQVGNGTTFTTVASSDCRDVSQSV